MTETEESAMASPATSGGSRVFMAGKRAPAAIGMPRQLYPSAQTKFHRMRRKTVRAKS